VHVFPDRGTKELDVCNKFGATHHLTFVHGYHGNSFNVCEALKWASTQAPATVYVVEDDAIIDKTFFSWCRTALVKFPQAFAACGWKYSPDAIIGTWSAPDMLLAWYLSVCAALPWSSVQSIAQHARPDYYENMKDYLDKAYPTSTKRGTQHFEQDGLCYRVMESESKRCVWPRLPRATHVGYHGYHQGGKALEGTFEERVYLTKLAIKKPGILATLMNGGSTLRMGRCSTCKALLAVDRQDLTAICSECFHSKHPNLAVTSDSHYYLGKGA